MMSDIIDNANDQQDKMLAAGIDNRIKFTEWDGLPRECSECLNLINIKRLEAINAKTCIVCADNEEKRR